MTADYRKDYRRGWTYASRGWDLDRADLDGRSATSAWMDGYEDRAAGREMYHRENCPNHPACEESRLPTA